MTDVSSFEISEPAIETTEASQRNLGAAEGLRSTRVKEEDGKLYTVYEHDVSKIIEANKFQQNEAKMHHDQEVFNHVGRIDVLAIKNWCAKMGITQGWWEKFFEDEKLLKAFLNDPDNKVWRTRLGKI